MFDHGCERTSDACSARSSAGVLGLPSGDRRIHRLQSIARLRTGRSQRTTTSTRSRPSWLATPTPRRRSRTTARRSNGCSCGRRGQLGKPLSSLTHEDLLAYQRFLADPQPRARWVNASRKAGPRSSRLATLLGTPLPFESAPGVRDPERHVLVAGERRVLGGQSAVSQSTAFSTRPRRASRASWTTNSGRA